MSIFARHSKIIRESWSVPTNCPDSVADMPAFENHGTKPRAPNKKDEWKLQMAAAKMLNHILPADMEWWANEDFGFIGEFESKMRKARGCKAGKPDFEFLPLRRMEFFVEMKIKGGKLTATQKVLFPRIQATGRAIHICWSLDDVMTALDAEKIQLRGRMI